MFENIEENIEFQQFMYVRKHNVKIISYAYIRKSENLRDNINNIDMSYIMRNITYISNPGKCTFIEK